MATAKAEPEPEMAVYLASKGAAAQTEASNNAVVYGALSMGVIVAGAAYFIKKSMNRKGTVDKSSLLDKEDQI